jgi:hypothetical protein
VGVFGNAWLLLQVHRARLDELVYRARAISQQ